MARRHARQADRAAAGARRAPVRAGRAAREAAADPLIRAASFDFGGTLAYEEDPAGLLAARREAVGRILGSRGVEPETVERVWAAMLRELERLEREGSPTSSAHAARFLVEHALGADDVETVEALRADLENPPGRPQRLRLVDGAVELLTWLHGQGIACGILSNSGLSSGAYNVEWMRRSGILPLFAEGAVLFSDEIGVAKPARAAFDLCRERLGCEADELLHVGDDLWADVHGARSAGLATARVSRFTTPQELPDADIVVESLSQLRPVYA